MAEDKTGGAEKTNNENSEGNSRENSKSPNSEINQENTTKKREETGNNRGSTGMTNVGEFDYLLFLVFVLLLVASQHTFSPYINLFQQQAGDIKKALDTFSLTAEELKNVMAAPRKIYQ